jgi:hypothetical protein
MWVVGGCLLRTLHPFEIYLKIENKEIYGACGSLYGIERKYEKGSRWENERWDWPLDLILVHCEIGFKLKRLHENGLCYGNGKKYLGNFELRVSKEKVIESYGKMCVLKCSMEKYL